MLLFLTHPLYPSFVFYLFSLFTFLSLALRLFYRFSSVPQFPGLFLPLSVSFWPPTAVRDKVLGERSLERWCTCSFPLLNSMHQSRRCLFTSGGRLLNALHMQPETICQHTVDVNAGPEPGFMHMQSTLSVHCGRKGILRGRPHTWNHFYALVLFVWPGENKNITAPRRLKVWIVLLFQEKCSGVC